VNTIGLIIVFGHIILLSVCL